MSQVRASNQYNCQACQYQTSNTTLWRQHCATNKHRLNSTANQATDQLEMLQNYHQMQTVQNCVPIIFDKAIGRYQVEYFIYLRECSFKFSNVENDETTITDLLDLFARYHRLDDNYRLPFNPIRQQPMQQATTMNIYRQRINQRRATETITHHYELVVYNDQNQITYQPYIVGQDAEGKPIYGDITLWICRRLLNRVIHEITVPWNRLNDYLNQMPYSNNEHDGINGPYDLDPQLSNMHQACISSNDLLTIYNWNSFLPRLHRAFKETYCINLAQ